MEYNIYISNHYYNDIYRIIFMIIFYLLKIKYNFVNNYDDKIDFIIKPKNNIDENILIDNKIIINSFKNTLILSDKKILNNYKIIPYNFVIEFNNNEYDKELMKKMIDNYKNYYNENFGNDLWILKNTKSR